METMDEAIEEAVVNSSMISKDDDNWIIAITIKDDEEFYIECNSVDEYMDEISKLGDRFDDIKVVWKKDIYLRPEHFEDIFNQMENYKELKGDDD